MTRDAPKPTVIPTIVAPSAAVFQREYARRSRPVVLKGVVDGSPASRHWSPAYLLAAYADAKVKVTGVRSSAVADPRKGIVRDELRLGVFLEALMSGAPAGYLTSLLDELPPAWQREFPIPAYCVDAPWRVSKVWIGAADAPALLHYDLADNLHTVISGGKRFILYSSDEDALVYPAGLFSSVPNGARVDPENPDYERFPLFARAHPMIAELGPGDTLFIPHGFWHHVRTREIAIAVNSFWARGRRLPVVVAADVFKRLRGISR